MDLHKVLRTLFNENTKSASEEAVRLLIKIAENILKDPSNLKLRTLQKSNGLVSTRILPVKGALDCLKFMGFREEGKCYVLPINGSAGNLEKFKTEIEKFQNQPDPDNGVLNKENKANTINCEPEVIKKVALPPLVLTYRNPFLQNLERSYHSVLQYEDKSLQKRALKLVPLTTLEENAQKRLRNIQEHIKKNKLDDPSISIQDTLILELLHWFKNDFFSWVDSPECENCSGKTKFSHMSTDPDTLIYTDRVELHLCGTCQKLTPFPRYNDLNILLETRKGRCGEWANVFTLFCRAMAWDSRYVADVIGDHVWTEVYSFTQKRWLHCDPCENICDSPLIYESGWKKQISYIIAYSAEEIQDVTWRYSSNHKEVLSRRRKCSEQELLTALLELRSKRQKNLSDAKKKYLTTRLLNELVEFLTEKKPNDGDSKGRTSGSESWRFARGEVREDKTDTLYIWELNGEDVVDDTVTIRYCPALDQYEYISGGKVLKQIQGWENGAYTSSNIFRKEEHDWKMVYLARREGQDSGNIIWKVKLNSTKSIDSVSLHCASTTFQNGTVDVGIHSKDNHKVLKGAVDNSSFFSGEKELTVSVTLSGGKGDVSWQHAQLFRKNICDEESFPFVLTLRFK